ncbi:cysteine desulfurase family protein [Salimicrobium halophilum]|uniref:cysteine desulfurase n=1 Tax=Salimicrobium halophilum TaxID=86666 RepID=A0A1G8PLZ8_9BACI|nr:cysteine desulfurase family protein [Salimicrobium halophilum]SDI93487.1 cysteine desulfurase [Salimicrobium halophilum]
MEGIYLDHAATTPVHEDVIQAMIPAYREVYGNPSSIHQFGRKARKILDEARRTIASSLGAGEKEIIFTSGGTEADNLAIFGVTEASEGRHVITTSIEHHAVLHAVQSLEQKGYDITYIDPEPGGEIDPEKVRESLRDDTVLVSVMTVNNETGVRQPVERIGEILEDHEAHFHSDGVQVLGIENVDVKEMNIDLMAFSGHKINGPKGIGFLYVKEGVPLTSRLYGGEQERKRRAGTENVQAIKGLETAVKLKDDTGEDTVRQYRKFKSLFLDTLRKEEVSFDVNGENAVPSIVNISFTGMNVETLLTNFDLEKVAASSGSACTAGSVEPSHVLSAMFPDEPERTTNSIRFSFGLQNTEQNVEEAARRIAAVCKRLTK